MSVTYLKRATPRCETENTELRSTVSAMLAKITADGEPAVQHYAKTLDQWDGPIRVSQQDRARAHDSVPAQLKSDLQFAYDNIRRFAEAQKATMGECEIELIPGHWAGQKQIPIASAGCYVPGGRYSHIASALMTITSSEAALGPGAS